MIIADRWRRRAKALEAGAVVAVMAALGGCVANPFPGSTAAATQADYDAAAHGPAGTPPASGTDGAASAAATAASDPFAEGATDHATPTYFAPQFSLSLSSQAPGDEPSVKIFIRQVKTELQTSSMRMLIGGAKFHFERAVPDAVVCAGTMVVGLPPKFTFDATAKVVSGADTGPASLTLKADGQFGHVYVADWQIRQLPTAIAVVSIGNAAKAAAASGALTLPVGTTFDLTIPPGWVTLPRTPGPMRVQTIFTSEPDPVGGDVATKVFEQTFDVR